MSHTPVRCLHIHSSVEQLTQTLREQQKQFGDSLSLTVEKPPPGDLNLEFFIKLS
jgi:hypothetical protein